MHRIPQKIVLRLLTNAQKENCFKIGQELLERASFDKIAL